MLRQLHQIKIDDLAIKETLEELYQRHHVDYRKAIEYAQAMKMGVKFPPIHVGVFDGKQWVVDGIHRIKAKQRIKQQMIEATIKDYSSLAEMFLDAAKLNATHGLPYKFSEKAVILRRMIEKFKIPKRKASEILGIPIPRFTVFLERTFIDKDNKIRSFKASVWKAMKQQSFDEKEIEAVAENIDQDIVTSTRIKSLLREFLQAIRNNLVPLNDPEVKELTEKIYDGLQEMLKIG